MITKFKIFEGVKWYNKGKWEEDTSFEEERCDHKWTLKQKTLYDRHNFHPYVASYIECVKCGLKSEVTKKKK